jgi:hypothetical protein
LAAADAFPPSSKEATLSQHQRNLLQESRNALYTALSSGSRHHSSKAHNSFTWRPDLDGGRAVCDAGNSVYGVQFSNIGHFNQKRKTLELLPEEALYMVERGAIELWKESSSNGTRVPMSVQQAWSELLGHDEMTPERYQVRCLRSARGRVCTLGLTSRGRNPFLGAGLRLFAAVRLRGHPRAANLWRRTSRLDQKAAAVPHRARHGIAADRLPPRLPPPPHREFPESRPAAAPRRQADSIRRNKNPSSRGRGDQEFAGRPDVGPLR